MRSPAVLQEKTFTDFGTHARDPEPERDVDEIFPDFERRKAFGKGEGIQAGELELSEIAAGAAELGACFRERTRVGVPGVGGELAARELLLQGLYPAAGVPDFLRSGDIVARLRRCEEKIGIIRGAD